MIDCGHKKSCPLVICKNTATVFNEIMGVYICNEKANKGRNGQEHTDFKGLINRHACSLGHAIS